MNDENCCSFCVWLSDIFEKKTSFEEFQNMSKKKIPNVSDKTALEKTRQVSKWDHIQVRGTTYMAQPVLLFLDIKIPI